MAQNLKRAPLEAFHFAFSSTFTFAYGLKFSQTKPLSSKVDRCATFEAWFQFPISPPQLVFMVTANAPFPKSILLSDDDVLTKSFFSFLRKWAFFRPLSAPTSFSKAAFFFLLQRWKAGLCSLTNNVKINNVCPKTNLEKQ